MPSQRIFAADELARARSMRAEKASWRCIGRELGCNEETIRCALDDAFLRSRHDRIVALKRERNEAAKVAREAKEARNAAAARSYPPTRINSAHHPKRMVSVGRLTSLRGFA